MSFHSPGLLSSVMYKQMLKNIKSLVQKLRSSNHAVPVRVMLDRELMPGTLVMNQKCTLKCTPINCRVSCTHSHTHDTWGKFRDQTTGLGFERQEETEELEKLNTDNNLSSGSKQSYWSCETAMLLQQAGCHSGEGCNMRGRVEHEGDS